MGKYSDIVKSKNESGKPENQKATNTDNNKTSKQQINKTGNTENQTTINTNSKKTSDLENHLREDMVNLSIKVPRSLRQKWVAESRLRGTTLTAIITDYLKTELGE